MPRDRSSRSKATVNFKLFHSNRFLIHLRLYLSYLFLFPFLLPDEWKCATTCWWWTFLSTWRNLQISSFIICALCSYTASGDSFSIQFHLETLRRLKNDDWKIYFVMEISSAAFSKENKEKTKVKGIVSIPSRESARIFNAPGRMIWFWLNSTQVHPSWLLFLGQRQFSFWLNSHLLSFTACKAFTVFSEENKKYFKNSWAWDALGAGVCE